MEQVNREELERAARRIMEMNTRAQSAVSRRKQSTPEPSPKLDEDTKGGKHEKPSDSVAPLPRPKSRNSIFDVINFKNLAGDNDRTLLAGIMLLLGADAADEKLMLALLYVML